MYSFSGEFPWRREPLKVACSYSSKGLEILFSLTKCRHTSLLNWNMFLSTDILPLVHCSHQCHGPLFEDTGEWLQDVENSVISTGNKLYTHADIPTTGSADQLLEELEELAVQLTICNQPVGRGWAARLLLKLTYFSYGVITDLYMRLAENWHGASMEKSIHLVTSIAFILSQWVSAVSE